jgi:hypothetical protein
MGYEDMELIQHGPIADMYEHVDKPVSRTWYTT